MSGITWDKLNTDQRGMLAASVRRNIFIQVAEETLMKTAETLRVMGLLEVQRITATHSEFAYTEAGHRMVMENSKPAPRYNGDGFDAMNQPIPQMDEQVYMEQVGRIMSDNTLLPVESSIKEAWLLISGLQLASRHPGISPYMKSALESIGRTFQQAIVEKHPDAAELVEMGWNPDLDVTHGKVYVSQEAKQRLMDEYGLTDADFVEGVK